MFLLYQRTPFILNIVIGPVIAYVTMAMNAFVFFILSAKDFINVATILMRALAVADGLTAFCTYGLEPMFNHFYTPLKKDTVTWKTDFDQLIDLKYPYCILHYLTSQLADTFHMTSVFLTSCLALQKMVAVMFPIWSRVNMTNGKGYCVTLLCYLLPISITLPKICFIKVSSQEENSCVSINSKAIQSYILKYFPMLFTIILVIFSIVMIISTIIIIAVLINRKSIRGRNSMPEKEKKSCCLIVIVVVVFLASEIPRTYLNVSLFGEYSQEIEDDIVFNKITNNHISATKVCFEKPFNQKYKARNLSKLDFHNMAKKWQSTLQNDKNTLITFGYMYSSLVALRDINYVHVFNKTVSRVLNAVKEQMTTELTQAWLYLQMILERDGDEQFNEMLNKIVKCVYKLEMLYGTAQTYLYLGLSPYNEQMNYMVTVSMNTWDVNINKVKIFIEILKISTLVGCASNFFIYVMLSEKIKAKIKQKCCQ